VYRLFLDEKHAARRFFRRRMPIFRFFSVFDMLCGITATLF